MARRTKSISAAAEGTLRTRARGGIVDGERIFAGPSGSESRDLRTLHVKRRTAIACGGQDASADERWAIRRGSCERIACADRGMAVAGAPASAAAGFAAGRIPHRAKLFFASAFRRC